MPRIKTTPHILTNEEWNAVQWLAESYMPHGYDTREEREEGKAAAKTALALCRRTLECDEQYEIRTGKSNPY